MAFSVYATPAADFPLGLEAARGMYWRGARSARRLLSRLVSDALSEAIPHPPRPMRTWSSRSTISSARFSRSDLAPNSCHTDKLFTRGCRITRNHFSDPDLSPRNVASEAGISLRYLQKVPGARNNVKPIHSVLRLDHAALLRARRKWPSHTRSLARLPMPAGSATTRIFLEHSTFDLVARQVQSPTGILPAMC
jgi:AraC family transcriptional regulator, positive regulator of tynA and feaB